MISFVLFYFCGAKLSLILLVVLFHPTYPLSSKPPWLKCSKNFKNWVQGIDELSTLSLQLFGESKTILKFFKFIF